MTAPELPGPFDHLVPGPNLVYVPGPDHEGLRTTTAVDLAPLDDPRERALCRALLVHALTLLDQSEPTRVHPAREPRP